MITLSMVVEVQLVSMGAEQRVKNAQTRERRTLFIVDKDNLAYDPPSAMPCISCLGYINSK